MKSISEDFSKSFSKEILEEIYFHELAHKKSSGVDNISTKLFEKNLNENIEIIIRKTFSGTYELTRYKQKLISKGANKPPREVCIPTLRDSLMLKALNRFLQKRLSKRVDQPLPQNITQKIKNVMKSDKYDWVIKLDVSNFYPSVKHKTLRKNLRRFIPDENILNLIEKSIRQTTGMNERADQGIPQGLPISNILAALYFRNIDRSFKNKNNFYYQRYVDDIIVICKKSEAEEISKDIIKKCQRIGLKIHDPKLRPDKSKSCHLSNEFSYLGYRYNPSNNQNAIASTGHASKQKLIDSITGLFTSYQKSKKRSKALLQWRINLRVTGCISENTGKGWIFFFSEIDDKTLLFQLDKVVDSLKSRFEVSFESKRFVRAWHEINHNRWRKSYFPNFDKYDILEMSKVVATHQGITPEKLTLDDDSVIKFFWIIIKKEIKDMDADIQPFS